MCALCPAPATPVELRVFDKVRVALCEDCHFEVADGAVSCVLPRLIEAGPVVVAMPNQVMVEIARELSAMVRG